ncbi:hypothetical protein PHLCEN_2v1574 [Hermanssonia centrifuga]|uniref:Uncharacterized protein n=1 Tax=Hermanssonia centrifuga TaxID=98765 RepID=A0A2R6RZL5_9APHY|nr:hypothetical protein PHLCEN_2v1574 [Hermanssonia centrifuga]
MAPGPLRELPLERFIHSIDSNINASHSSLPLTHKKRPLSPGSSTSLRPAKRRIQAKVDASLSTNARHAASHVKNIRNLARKLEFGIAEMKLCGDENVMTEPEPRHRTRSVVLYQASTTSSRPSTFTPAVSVALSKRTKPVRSSRSRSCTPSDVDMEMCSLEHQSSAMSAIRTISRTAIAPDRHSMHYPGFDVFQDTCDYIYAKGMPPICLDVFMTSCGSNKENVAPVFRPSKPLLSMNAFENARTETELTPHGEKMWATEKSGGSLSIVTTSEMRGIVDIGNIREGSLTPTSRKPGMLSPYHITAGRRSDPEQSGWVAKAVLEDKNQSMDYADDYVSHF